MTLIRDLDNDLVDTDTLIRDHDTLSEISIVLDV